MKRISILVLVYSLVFLAGYFGLGWLLLYLKPEIHMLPESVERMIIGEDWERQTITPQENIPLKFNLIGAKNSEETILFTDDYNQENGIFCFRGNAQRNNPVRGTLSKAPSSIQLVWTFETLRDDRVSETGSWGGGSGWTGQSLLVKWPKKLKQQLFQLQPNYLQQDDFIEVIQGSLSGEIYFIDFKTGKATRPPLSIQNPIKGTVSLDPRLNGLLYVGQGIPNSGRFGSYVFNLFTGKEVYFRNGLDPTARRQWGAFDSNSLIDPKTGFWFHPAENGQIYKAKVSSSEKISSPTKFNYVGTKHWEHGLEASMGAWNNLGYFGDNGGNVFCLDLISMKPLWWIDNFDDTDASLVIDVEPRNNPYLYVGCEVDKQGEIGTAHFRKINALTGEAIWDIQRTCGSSKLNGRVNSGGVLSSALIGKHKANHLVYTIFSRTNNTWGGELVAIDKKTGKEVFVIHMTNYSWASPIALYTKSGQPYLFFTDVFGNVYLADGLTGKIIFKEHYPVVWESSPTAWNNQIVVGARGNKIFSFKLH